MMLVDGWSFFIGFAVGFCVVVFVQEWRNRRGKK